MRFKTSPLPCWAPSAGTAQPSPAGQHSPPSSPWALGQLGLMFPLPGERLAQPAQDFAFSRCSLRYLCHNGVRFIPPDLLKIGNSQKNKQTKKHGWVTGLVGVQAGV